MASHSQHQQGNSTGKRGGAGQTIVELCAVSACGLVFWSRQRFDIGSELQIRVRRDAIPTLKDAPEGTDEWVTLRGYVVECPSVRRESGEHGFEVSLLLDSALTMAPQPRENLSKRACPRMKKMFPGLKRVGLN
ncbi:MAG TPA: hypothetical protein VGE29_04025 [Prosthecobacter sp.]